MFSTCLEELGVGCLALPSYWVVPTSYRSFPSLLAGLLLELPGCFVGLQGHFHWSLLVALLGYKDISIGACWLLCLATRTFPSYRRRHWVAWLQGHFLLIELVLFLSSVGSAGL